MGWCGGGREQAGGRVDPVGCENTIDLIPSMSSAAAFSMCGSPGSRLDIPRTSFLHRGSLRTENRVLREQLGGRRLRLTNDQRRRNLSTTLRHQPHEFTVAPSPPELASAGRDVADPAVEKLGTADAPWKTPAGWKAGFPQHYLSPASPQPATPALEVG